MPYQITPFFAGGFYHIYNRGNNREPIFIERENYLFFMRQLRKYFTPDKVEIVAYCLMPNHYHILIHLLADSPSEILQAFTLSYVKAINKRYGRVGSLFQGPFQSRYVDKNEYLLHLSRYIHANPVAASLVRSPEDWEFSSYRDYVGLRNESFIRPEFILKQYGVERYREFAEAYQPADTKSIRLLLFDE
jgi:REP element-mobilizing transposase RayT